MVAALRTTRWRLRVRGLVQGVGFRPHVYRLARALDLAGSVRNTADGATIEVEGGAESLAAFHRRLLAELPPVARIDTVAVDSMPAAGVSGFRIEPSQGGKRPEACVLPDLATCPACLAELFDPADRRYRYPFINCTHCGPRLSIISGLPYDRANTTMAGFRMCADCAREYADPADRRFHAQPNACPECGPQLAFLDAGGRSVAAREAALAEAVARLAAGDIVAVKGLGGFHLMADAGGGAAVERLRRRKHRPRKPLAVMAADLPMAEAVCRVSPDEAALLCSPQAPIVLLARRGGGLPEALAPGNPNLGVMLAYTPLHHLLLKALGRPLVATSGNLSDEPICAEETEAVARLAGIADGFLVHDRPIQRPVDDSVVQIAAGRPMLLRGGRGYAPLGLTRPEPGSPGVAVGAFLKDTVAVATRAHWVLGPHIGDLDSVKARDAFRRTLADLEALYGVVPRWVARDRHPDYPSSTAAEALGPPAILVQHHHAHVAAVMAEHGLHGEVLGVAWDGVGLGDDGAPWGGEFLRATRAGYRRVAAVRPFSMPGGDRAAREPWRCAAGLRFAAGLEPLDARGREAAGAAAATLVRMLERGVNSPVTTSVGRLFDAVASLLGLCHRSSFEGEAAMALQFQAERAGAGHGAYRFPLQAGERVAVLDWEPGLAALLADREAGAGVPVMAARFHGGLADALAAVARSEGLPRVVLGGGCFQNRHLLRLAVERLGRDGVHAFWPAQVPANDGGIALGQLAVACAQNAQGVDHVSGGAG